MEKNPKLINVGPTFIPNYRVLTFVPKDLAMRLNSKICLEMIFVSATLKFK